MQIRPRDIGVATGIGLWLWNQRRNQKSYKVERVTDGEPASVPSRMHASFDDRIAEAMSEYRERFVFSVLPATLFLISLIMFLPQGDDASLRAMIRGVRQGVGLSPADIIGVNLALSALAAALTIALVLGAESTRTSVHNMVWAGNTVTVAHGAAALSLTLAGLSLLGVSERSDLLQALVALAVAALTAMLVAAVGTWEGKNEFQRLDRLSDLRRCREVLQKYELRSEPGVHNVKKAILVFAAIVALFQGTVLFLLQRRDIGFSFGLVVCFVVVFLTVVAHIGALLFVLNLEFHSSRFERSTMAVFIAVCELASLTSFAAVALSSASTFDRLAWASLAVSLSVSPIVLTFVGWWKGWGWSGLVTSRQIERGRVRDIELQREIARLELATRRDQSWRREALEAPAMESSSLRSSP